MPLQKVVKIPPMAPFNKQKYVMKNPIIQINQFLSIFKMDNSEIVELNPRKL